MNINEKLIRVSKKLEQGYLAISEAEDLMDGYITEECLPILDDVDKWIKRYWYLKRKSWRLLLKATESKGRNNS